MRKCCTVPNNGTETVENEVWSFRHEAHCRNKMPCKIDVHKHVLEVIIYFSKDSPEQWHANRWLQTIVVNLDGLDG